MIRTRLSSFVLVGSLSLCSALAASAQTTKRPIQDWLAPNLGAGGIYWYDTDAPAPQVLIFFDYFGRQNALYSLNLGTTIDGTVTERALKNGRASVHVVMHASKVLTWATQGGPLIFGHTSVQVAPPSSLDPALGDTLLTVDFENKAPGAPLPSLFALTFVASPDYHLSSVGLTGNATGTLRAAFGVPEGTPGKAHTTQRGLYDVPGMQIDGHDVFPAEKVDIHPIE